ncbi:hypothetical protein ACI3L1_00880 [Deinococcus sp. SM5_A1]|uniref:hypothetical protein n=1 Tax=Deinococcus sp. SM5_A1 TaxID=3379094 RepID=UPI00385ED1C7
MKPWSVFGLIVLLILGAALTFFTAVAAAFATDSGVQDPIDAHFSTTMFTLLPVYPVCVIATLALMVMRRGRLALMAAIFHSSMSSGSSFTPLQSPEISDSA